MASLKLTDVTKIYPSGATALYNINLDADDREFLVIVGGEKCGKSTLLRVIAGLEQATGGVVEIGGKDVSDVDPKDRDVAMVFRSDTLYPTLNVYENMAFGLKLRKAPQALIDQRVKAAANILGLNEVLYRKPKTLTSQARQRVALGRAIVREPKLYLFDEPLAGLDEKLRLDMLNVIINMQARMNGTFVYATKNLSEALTIGTRIVVMKEGLVQQIDTPSNLYDYPANTFVAFYIGSPTINFVQNARILKEGESYFAEAEDIKLQLPQKIVERFKAVDDYCGGEKNIILGIRPEDVTVCAEGEIEGELGKCESSDGKTYAECKLGDKLTLLATCEKEGEKGAAVKIKIDCERLLIFDGETRLTLLSRDGGYRVTGKSDADFVPLGYPEERAVVEKLKPKKDDKKGKKLR